MGGDVAFHVKMLFTAFKNLVECLIQALGKEMKEQSPKPALKFIILLYILCLNDFIEIFIYTVKKVLRRTFWIFETLNIFGCDPRKSIEETDTLEGSMESSPAKLELPSVVYGALPSRSPTCRMDTTFAGRCSPKSVAVLSQASPQLCYFKKKWRNFKLKRNGQFAATMQPVFTFNSSNNLLSPSNNLIEDNTTFKMKNCCKRLLNKVNDKMGNNLNVPSVQYERL